MNVRELIAQTEKNLLREHHLTLEKATPWQLNNALAQACMSAVAPAWVACEWRKDAARRAFYLSAEYLVGRMTTNNLLALGALEEARDLFSEKGVDINAVEDVEDMALGNGGLGRLAACFLDSAATCDIPLDGYGLRYRFGLFRQEFDGGRQVELPDDWTRWGDPWCVRRDELRVRVPMRTGEVIAVPYDMPVIGLGGESIATLRLWEAHSPAELDLALFNAQKYDRAAQAKNRAEDITKVLYPNDTLRAGKQMRIKQQYLLVSASLQDMLRRLDARGKDAAEFGAAFSVQLNDTHPAMAIPELVRLLMARGMRFDRALKVARGAFNYTNHTVMQEALETWDLDLIRSVSPELARIIGRIDHAFRAEIERRGVEPAGLAIVEDGRAHMARLAAYASGKINGVAEIHSEILKKTVLRRFYEIYPERFTNVTNGVTQRRWLMLCNPELSRLIASRIGTGFFTDLTALKGLAPHLEGMIDEFLSVKREKKRQLAAHLARREGVEVDPSFLFDVQIKRLHEYKRQLLNALSIYDLYCEFKAGNLPDFTPTLFLFGGKAAPGYARAKAIIYFINRLAEMIDKDEEARQVMRVVFVQDYNCSYAEKIIPAADLSEQISPAGTEASGTGNMKLMLNGAPTIGTYDGANVEIVREAGEENNYIFGATLEQLRAMENYTPRAIYEAEPRVKRAVDALTLFEVPGVEPGREGSLVELRASLLDGASWHAADHYYLLVDFMAYQEARLRALGDYRDERAYARKCLRNIVSAGKFSSDRAVRQYARKIWNL